MINQAETVLTELSQERQHYQEVLHKANQRESITQTESVAHFNIATETSADISIPRSVQTSPSTEQKTLSSSSPLASFSVSSSVLKTPAPLSNTLGEHDIAAEEDERELEIE